MAIAERDAYPLHDDLEDEDVPLTFAPMDGKRPNPDALDMFGFPAEDGAPDDGARFFAPQGTAGPAAPSEPDAAPSDIELDIWSRLKNDDVTDLDTAPEDTRAARALAAAVEPEPAQHEPAAVADVGPEPKTGTIGEDEFAPVLAPPPAAAPTAGAMILPPDSELGDLLAPRIAIHLFCRNAETAAAATRAAADRRMQRATPKVVLGVVVMSSFVLLFNFGVD